MSAFIQLRDRQVFCVCAGSSNALRSINGGNSNRCKKKHKKMAKGVHQTIICLVFEAHIKTLIIPATTKKTDVDDTNTGYELN